MTKLTKRTLLKIITENTTSKPNLYKSQTLHINSGLTNNVIKILIKPMEKDITLDTFNKIIVIKIQIIITIEGVNKFKS